MVEREGLSSAPIEIRRSSEIRDWNNPESLRREWGRQSVDLARRFADKLGFSREDYVASLPEFGSMPNVFKDKENVYPVLIDPRIPLDELLISDATFEEDGSVKEGFENKIINPMFDINELGRWPKNGKKQTLPQATWVALEPDKTVDKIRDDLKGNRTIRGGTVLDGVFLYLSRPDILNNRTIKLPGSRVGEDSAPFLNALTNPEGRGIPNHPSINRGSNDTISPKSTVLIASK